MLSICNFLLGLVFIKFATKHDYYAYSQLIGYVALTGAIQGALVNTTALTLLPGKVGAERVRVTNVFFGLQLVLSIVLAIAGGLFLWLVPSAISMEAIEMPLALAMAVMVLAAWLREFLRNVQFINLRAEKCLQQDIAYVLLLAPCIVALVLSKSVRADQMLLVIGAVGVITALPWLRQASISPVFDPTQWRALWREIWPLAKWSLPAGMVAWAFGNGYLVVGAQVVGPESTAEIVAAKLFMAPLGMMFLSWANIFRPKVSHWLSKGSTREVVRLTNLSIGGVAGIVALYFVVLVLAYPFLERYILGDKYHGLRLDIAWWGMFFVASGVSGVCNGVLLSGGKFRQSFYAAAISSTLSLPVMYFSGLEFGKHGLMVGVVLGESAYAAVLYVAMRRMLRVPK
ncbi:lipopolysaccharide biosynthesis protein [Aquabacterium sp.]|uniref:lipopolysaccharide biosynthesis protein n=1 Tax=Aquabacterium sp. TaxID=1872578 RepID=UPI003D6D75BC